MESLTITQSSAGHLRQLNRKIGDLNIECQQLNNKIMVFNNGIHQLIPTDQIIMIQSESNYSKIFLADGAKIMTSKTLKSWQNAIDNPKLIRIHASYLIHQDHIVSIDKKEHEISLTGSCSAKYGRDQAKYVSHILCHKSRIKSIQT